MVSFVTLGAAAQTRCRPVSRRCPPGSVALPGSWNFSPHSKVPEACIVSVSECLTGCGTGEGDSPLSFFPKSQSTESKRQTSPRLWGQQRGQKQTFAPKDILEDNCGTREGPQSRLMATTLHQDGATGQRRKLPHTSESVTETPPFPKAAQPLRASHPVCPLGPQASPRRGSPSTHSPVPPLAKPLPLLSLTSALGPQGPPASPPASP